MKEHNEGGEQYPHKKDTHPQRRGKSERSHPDEGFFEKNVPIYVSPESVFRLSFAHANELAEHPYSGNVHSSTIVAFAKIAEHNEDLETVQHWMQRLESQVATAQPPSEGLPDVDFARENNLARVYFIGATLGDAEALTKLDTMLANERDTYDDEEKSFDQCALTEIVMEAALAGIPADIWINRFAKDRTHALQLQSHYVFSAQETNSAGKPIAERYTKEITKALFQEETPDEVFWYHALDIMKNDDNPSKQSAVAYEAIARTPDTVDDAAFDTFLTFASRAVEDEMVTREQAEEMQEHAESYALTHHLSDDTKVTLSRFDLSVALAQETPADELLAKIKNSTQFQREHSLPQESVEEEALAGLVGRKHTRERVEYFEENFLIRCTRHFAEQHDFQSAKTFMQAITDHNAQLKALRHCVQEARTPEDLSLLKDDTNQSEKMQQLIYAQELYFTHQPENRTLALEFLTDAFMLQIAETWLKNGYETDITEGQTIAHEIGAAINRRPDLRSFESTIAKIQLENGDTEGFKTQYNHLKRTNAKAFRYLLLAQQCQQWMKEQGTTK